MIRKTFGIAALAMLLFSVSCKDNASSKIEASNLEMASTKADASGKYPVMTFNEKEFDFGTIKEGDKVEHVFTFKNTGEADLLIMEAKGSCGCTVPEFEKAPIKPGESSSMKVSFDSNGKPGAQQKSVNIVANTASGVELLTIKASVTPKAGGIQAN